MSILTPNPFIHGNPVQPDHFFGRKKELRRIVNRLLPNGQSSAIIGEPRSGKTSLLDFIAAPQNRAALYGDKKDHLRFTFLDAQTLSNQCTPLQFWQKALQPLEDISAQNPNSPLAKAYHNCHAQFDILLLENLLDKMRQDDWQLVLIVDEFDEFLNHPVLHTEVFFGSLRALMSRSRGTLSLITASRRSLTYLNSATQNLIRTGSPYFNFMAEFTLRTFDKDIAKLLALGKKYFSTEDGDFIKHLAGGHPYFLQVAAWALWETYEDGEEYDPEQRRQLAGEQVYQMIASTLDDIWKFWRPEMRKTFTIIALANTPTLLNQRQFKLKPFIESLGDFGPELDALKTQGFVIADNEIPGGYRIGPQVFVWWLNKNLTQAARNDETFNEWLQQQEIDGLLTKGQKQQLSQLAQRVTGSFRDTVASVIEIFAKILSGV